MMTFFSTFYYLSLVYGLKLIEIYISALEKFNCVFQILRNWQQKGEQGEQWGAKQKIALILYVIISFKIID